MFPGSVHHVGSTLQACAGVERHSPSSQVTTVTLTTKGRQCEDSIGCEESMGGMAGGETGQQGTVRPARPLALRLRLRLRLPRRRRPRFLVFLRAEFLLERRLVVWIPTSQYDTGASIDIRNNLPCLGSGACASLAGRAVCRLLCSGEHAGPAGADSRLHAACGFNFIRLRNN